MPLTDAQIIAAFGDPTPHLRMDGTPAPSWEQQILTQLWLPKPLPLSWDPTRLATKIRVHKRLVRAFRCALGIVFSNPEAWASIGDLGGVYAWRRMKSSKRVSRHGWAIAIDLDVLDNADGSTGNMHPHIIESFESQGFEWGGRWSERERDPMHFEFVDLSKLSA